jgi:hypothetical protein
VNPRFPCAAALLALFALSSPTRVSAETSAEAGEPKSRYSFELGAFLTATWYPKDLAVEGGVVSDRQIGFGGSLSLAYRGPFFLYPFLDIGFFNLAQSTIHPVSRLGISGDEVENALNAWTFLFGPGLDTGPMRFRLGVGLNRLETSMEGKNFSDDASAAGFVTSLMISGAVFRAGPFRLNVEGRTTYFMYATGIAFALGISGAADVFSW